MTARRTLERGEIELLGLMPNASNYTFLARVTHESDEALAVYKPRRGETPLWDFPDGTLGNREVAAFVVSHELGFGFVPPTVLRDGPHGPGSLQLFIDAQPGLHYLTIARSYDEIFRRVCLFDVVINNADRKSGHCLLEEGTGTIWVVDHGVSFHREPKLRTVIWDFAGERIPRDALESVEDFGARVADVAALTELLAADEVEAIRVRAEHVVKEGVFPEPGPGRPFPWPPV